MEGCQTVGNTTADIQTSTNSLFHTHTAGHIHREDGSSWESNQQPPGHKASLICGQLLSHNITSKGKERTSQPPGYRATEAGCRAAQMHDSVKELPKVQTTRIIWEIKVCLLTHSVSLQEVNEAAVNVTESEQVRRCLITLQTAGT